METFCSSSAIRSLVDKLICGATVEKIYCSSCWFQFMVTLAIVALNEISKRSKQKMSRTESIMKGAIEALPLYRTDIILQGTMATELKF